MFCVALCCIVLRWVALCCIVLGAAKNKTHVSLEHTTQNNNIECVHLPADSFIEDDLGGPVAVLTF